MASSTTTSTPVAPSVPTPVASTAESAAPSSSWLPKGLTSAFSSLKPLNLPKPGSLDMLNKEIKDVLTTHYVFDGAKVDLAKVLSPNFHVSHSFVLGSQIMKPTYSYSGVFTQGENGILLHGSIDSNGDLHGRVKYPPTQNLQLKSQFQIKSTEAVGNLEAEYEGSDFTAAVKANRLLSPEPSVSVGYLQSVTPTLALGLRAGVEFNLAASRKLSTMSLLARRRTNDGVFTGTIGSEGSFAGSYVHKVSDGVELGTEIEGNYKGDQRDVIVNVGAKLDVRSAAVRVGIDSMLRCSMTLEERVGPGLAFLVSGNIDHLMGQSIFGIGFMLEN